MEANIIARIRKDLVLRVDEKTKSSYSRFFKEEVTCYGVKSALVGKIAKDYFNEIKTEDKKEVFVLCEELLRSDYNEEAFIAFEWAYLVRNNYSEDDFFTFERWIENYVNNWAKCDTLCNHSGRFLY